MTLFRRFRFYDIEKREYVDAVAFRGEKGEPGDSPTRELVEEVTTTEINKLVDGAPTSYNTLKKIATWISSQITKTSTIETNVATNESDISSLKTKANTNATNIKANADAIAALATRVTSCENTVSSHTKTIASHTSSISTINTNISTLNTKVGQTLKVVSFDESTGELVTQLMD